MVRILFAGPSDRWNIWKAPLRTALNAAGIKAELSPDPGPPETVDYIIYAPNGPVQDFTPFTRTKAVLSYWAGVERVVGNPTLTQPLARLVDPGLTEGMVEWVTGHVLRYHLGMDTHIHGQDGVWRGGDAPPLARDRRVTILGLGALGAACATALAGLNFNATGWSRRAKALPDIRCLSGADGLDAALGGAQIVVLLLPLTAGTENVLNDATLARLAPGAFVLNPGRGPLIDDDALIRALDNGQVAHATLDVFRIEPLPADHPFWAHPRVTVTPHIASETRPATAAKVLVENIRRVEAGAPLLNEVDRAAGY